MLALTSIVTYILSNDFFLENLNFRQISSFLDDKPRMGNFSLVSCLTAAKLLL